MVSGRDRCTCSREEYLYKEEVGDGRGGGRWKRRRRRM
jgi:hypothetical protein